MANCAFASMGKGARREADMASSGAQIKTL
jgi:hypothetical protein